MGEEGEHKQQFSAEGTTFTAFPTSLSRDHMLESVSSGEGTHHQSMIAMSGRKICPKVNLELGAPPGGRESSAPKTQTFSVIYTQV